ncbi:C-C motif chemokine 28 isoform X2 [Rhinatrema bivittatum]|uniref:C-C motif chemokine 28 isoform X2 n=1 Tax=Rhinatrema bivittatum TaxID=194408 RepID=UPI00112AD5E5|nr:C-C motif chemokine 28 isoform X2 [Rhinatrema bivittatum]
MDVKITAVLVLLYLMQLSEPLTGSTSDCCTQLANHISKKILRRVLRFDMQRADGLCAVSALVLHTRHKKLCVNPKIQSINKWRKRNSKNRNRGNIHRGKKKKNKRRNRFA